MCVPVHVCACACAGVYMCISVHKICGNCMLDTDGTCCMCRCVYYTLLCTCTCTYVVHNTIQQENSAGTKFVRFAQ